MRSMLCIDDMEEDLQALELQFSGDYNVISCTDSSSALAMVKKHKPAVIILDLQMPGYNGQQVLSDLKTLQEAPPVIMLSGHTSPRFVVDALKAGADDFMEKPYNPVMLRRRIKLVIDRRKNDKKKLNTLKTPRFIGSSTVMQTLMSTLKTYASARLPVLITGESGTGKDMAARLIHAYSTRSGGPFIVRNIGALPESLIESELFGCEDGAYTGARARKGCFEEANSGTLFLDEIDSASLKIQTALLRSVEEGYVRRIGGNSSYQADCRLLFATNKNLALLVTQNLFREDLQYRIDGLSIQIPPLRDHREDIPELVDFFIRQYTEETREIDKEALSYLVSQPWPGNVRQLKACVEKALVLSGNGTLHLEHVRT